MSNGTCSEFELNMWQWFYDIERSADRHRREREYDQAKSEAGEGNILILLCEVSGSLMPMRIIIEDFPAFNWVMDRLDNPSDPLLSVVVNAAEISVEAIP